MFKTTGIDTLKQDKSVSHVGTSFCQPCLGVQQLMKHDCRRHYALKNFILIEWQTIDPRLGKIEPFVYYKLPRYRFIYLCLYNIAA